MTTIYFIRHAQPDFSNPVDALRELTEQGLKDSREVARFLADKQVDAVYSSPFIRAVDTVRPLAETKKLSIQLVEDFRERKVDDIWIEDFETFSRKQWKNFDYKLQAGESLREVQDRNIRALFEVLDEEKENTIVIGTHGTALGCIIHFFQPSFDFNAWKEIRNKMPCIIRMNFEGRSCKKMEEIW